jgi:hypothetical protein
MSAKEMQRYCSYRHLNPARREIRLLTIKDEQLRCYLSHTSLDDRPQYIALSYYWGAPGASKPIVLGGEMLRIGKTLYQFLKALYRKLGPVTVWLDVLCIDQDNLADQSSQVAMMGDIYIQACCVYAWFGKGDAGTDIALKSLHAGVDELRDPTTEGT